MTPPRADAGALAEHHDPFGIKRKTARSGADGRLGTQVWFHQGRSAGALAGPGAGGTAGPGEAGGTGRDAGGTAGPPAEGWTGKGPVDTAGRDEGGPADQGPAGAAGPGGGGPADQGPAGAAGPGDGGPADQGAGGAADQGPAGAAAAWGTAVELRITTMPRIRPRIPTTISQPTADSSAVTRPQSCATVLSMAEPIWPMGDWHNAFFDAITP